MTLDLRAVSVGEARLRPSRHRCVEADPACLSVAIAIEGPNSSSLQASRTAQPVFHSKCWKAWALSAREQRSLRSRAALDWYGAKRRWTGHKDPLWASAYFRSTAISPDALPDHQQVTTW